MLLHVFPKVQPNQKGVSLRLCRQTERWPIHCGQSTDHRNKGRAHVCLISYDASFAHPLGYTECSYTVSNSQCTIYIVHGIMTVLLNYATLHETELM